MKTPRPALHSLLRSCALLLGSVIGLCFFIPSPAPAQSTAAPPSSRTVPPSLKKLYDQRQAEMAILDKNGDGVLSPEELAAGTQMKFEAADANKDGIVTQAERDASIGAFKQTHQEKYGAQTANKAVQLQNRFEAADTNKDGQVSKQEYDAYYGQRYQKLDKNKDGKLDLREYQTDTENSRRRRRDN